MEEQSQKFEMGLYVLKKVFILHKYYYKSERVHRISTVVAPVTKKLRTLGLVSGSLSHYHSCNYFCYRVNEVNSLHLTKKNYDQK